MKICLDIGGVLLIKQGDPAVGVVGFLEKVTGNHDCYWLTTHCKNDSTNYVVRHFESKLPKEAVGYVHKVKANGWDYLKTEGVDFSTNFLWFDDNLMFGEKESLMV